MRAQVRRVGQLRVSGLRLFRLTVEAEEDWDGFEAVIWIIAMVYIFGRVSFVPLLTGTFSVRIWSTLYHFLAYLCTFLSLIFSLIYVVCSSFCKNGGNEWKVAISVFGIFRSALIYISHLPDLQAREPRVFVVRKPISKPDLWWRC